MAFVRTTVPVDGLHGITAASGRSIASAATATGAGSRATVRPAWQEGQRSARKVEPEPLRHTCWGQIKPSLLRGLHGFGGSLGRPGGASGDRQNHQVLVAETFSPRCRPLAVARPCGAGRRRFGWPAHRRARSGPDVGRRPRGRNRAGVRVVRLPVAGHRRKPRCRRPTGTAVRRPPLLRLSGVRTAARRCYGPPATHARHMTSLRKTLSRNAWNRRPGSTLAAQYSTCCRARLGDLVFPHQLRTKRTAVAPCAESRRTVSAPITLRRR